MSARKFVIQVEFKKNYIVYADDIEEAYFLANDLAEEDSFANDLTISDCRTIFEEVESSEEE